MKVGARRRSAGSGAQQLMRWQSRTSWSDAVEAAVSHVAARTSAAPGLLNPPTFRRWTGGEPASEDFEMRRRRRRIDVALEQAAPPAVCARAPLVSERARAMRRSNHLGLEALEVVFAPFPHVELGRPDAWPVVLPSACLSDRRDCPDRRLHATPPAAGMTNGRRFGCA
ncbi:MAG: hypothetical protein IT176_02140 [Acidobacteria bacterium]|nr:hypothetical protein [Acidobacteriota bacterium]